MVAHDKEFSVDLTQLNDEKLKERRLNFVRNLFNGYEGSIDNVEKKALIREIDIEFERRYKKTAQTRSWVAIVISIIAIFVSIIGLFID